MELSKDDAIKFFGGLYAGSGGGDSIERGEFYKIATKFVVDDGEQTTVGTAALQSLVLNYLLGSQNPKQAQANAVMIAHISRPGIGTLVKEFPNATIDDLIRAAKEEGFSVEVL